MPPVSPQQGSRAGLITALVIFVVLFVTATVLAIYFNTKWKASEIAVTQTEAKYAPAANDTDLTLPVVRAAQLPQTGIELALAQRDTLAKIIDGSATGNADAITAHTAQALTDVRGTLTQGLGTKDANGKVTEPPIVKELAGNDNVLSSLARLAKALVAQKALTDQAVAASEKAKADAVAANDSVAKAISEKEEAVKAAQAKFTADAATEKTRADAVVASVEDIKTSTKSDIEKVGAAQGVLQAELTKQESAVKTLAEQLNRAKAQIAKNRLDTSRPLIHPAGQITRVPGDNICFINLGQGDQVSPGMTFEVYDKKKGLPPVTGADNAPDSDLPAGKASIEIIRVLPGTSECRIIKQTATIVEGDLILNFIYNTHGKFNFVVYGDFDLANTGQATPGDAEIIKRLITQWGGRVQDTPSVDTDFVVLGKTPVVTPLSDAPGPLEQSRFDAARKALEAYGKTLDLARELHIPVLNQNRFLYFVGYYDQATR